jgi:hypothetical protein
MQFADPRGGVDNLLAAARRLWSKAARGLEQPGAEVSKRELLAVEACARSAPRFAKRLAPPSNEGQRHTHIKLTASLILLAVAKRSRERREGASRGHVGLGHA